MRPPRDVMPLRLLVFLAWRGLLQSRLITCLLCAAVAGGVAFQIPNDANLHGYDDEIIAQGVVVGSGDVRVRPREGARFPEGDALAARIARRDGVVAAVPAIMLPGAIGKGSTFKSALIVAVDGGASRVPFVITEGRAVATGDGSSIVVGSALAKRIGVAVGEEVQLRVVFGAGWESIDPENDVGRYTMKVVGLAAGSFLAPESIVVDRAFMTGALAEPHAASVILVHLGDHFAARSTASDLERDEPTASAVAWADDSPFLGSALDASAAIGVLSRAMIGLAVLIPVWALLYVHVLHRQRQIGVMGAIGLSRREVFAIHLMQAALVGVVGVIVGCAVGYALVAWFAHHPIFRSTGFVILPVVSVQSFAVPALLVLGTTLLAGVFPAWRASRLDPARILRGGA
ncbi:MAG: ABC transporter permease [Myxococcales bacterium]|nr:ABC transporter permease [Myxococcales bacterium]